MIKFLPALHDPRRDELLQELGVASAWSGLLVGAGHNLAIFEALQESLHEAHDAFLLDRRKLVSELGAETLQGKVQEMSANSAHDSDAGNAKRSGIEWAHLHEDRGRERREGEDMLW